MSRDILQRYFFIGLSLCVSGLIFFMFLPFLEVIVLSGIFTVVLSPFYERLVRHLGDRRGISAFIITIVFAFIIIIPATFLTLRVLNESNDLYTQLTAPSEENSLQKITDAVEKPIQAYFPEFTLEIREYVGSAADFIVGHLTSIVSSVIAIVTSFILIFFSMFFLLRDGAKFKKILINLSPLDDKYDEQILEKITISMNSTIKGVILVAIIQGILAGIGMMIFGVPNATLWGSVSALASLVPGLGTAIVFVPAIIYMYIIGNTFFAIGLLLWGIVIVGLVDNFLTPYLYSRGSEIHPLIMLFAVLGGLIVFGPIGFIFGPIILALFFSLIEIYQSVIVKNKSD